MTRAFYLHLICKHQFCDMSRNNSLYSRCSSICKIKSISLMRYTFDSKYAMRCKQNATILPPDGISNTINTLLLNYDHNSMQTIKMLLKPYELFMLQTIIIHYSVIIIVLYIMFLQAART